MADFIEVSSRKEAQRLAYQHYQDKGSLTGGTKYILPDGTKLRVRKRISNVSGASDLKAEDFDKKTKSDVARSTRIRSSRKEINRAIKNEAAAQWDELVGDRNATINIGGKPYSFDKYLNKEVRDHSKLTRQKAVESVNLGKSLGHGTPTTDVGRYAESYTQQFAETPSGNYSTQDYIPPDQLKRLQKAGLATSPQEAARLHVGTTKIGGRLPDPEIEKTLKINLGDKPVQASRLMPQGVTRNPQVVPTRSQSLGQRATAIVNREPLPQPKPQPTVKMASTRSQQTKEAARRARLQGAELSKINMKGKSLKEMEVAIREAKARANAAYSAGKDVAPKPTAKPPQGRDKLKREQKLRRSEEKAKQASRLKTAKAQAEPKPTAKPARKSAAAKPKPIPKPSRVRRAGGGTSNRTNKPTGNSVRNPGSASQQIRRLQNSAPGVVNIYPGMGLPSNTLFRGV